ncbi:hypothetical protein GGS23DRAFT_454040 [Durotheca rogersii]|uniref:uncharacterized protein n=1 Tax=Durotheca rogersii TaxID=419775 RepID=UPI002220546B|nr:uncharacterized protein GGS23DRAFT_454040 [Durotheca rogersii]KAI5864583.1 hypothetical protein GGS23DRAFT_454040 [Durotheca rogersii]
MWFGRERRRVITILPHLLLLLPLSANRALGQADASASTAHDAAKSPPTTVPSAELTCASKTVNYITHTLPQQCLTASPSPLSTPESSSAAAAASPSAAESTAEAAAHDDLDADGNDLSTGAFMSFEQWKAMMLEKSGQDALEPRHHKSRDTHGGVYPGEDFDSLGDEGEVSFDFDAYSDRISEITSATRPSQKEKEAERQDDKVTYDEGLAQGYRSKDAGTTCKERFSYASFDAGATIKKASPGAKNPKAILVENKDSYMLLECAMQNKFFIVELSDDILVDTVVLANFEFFSSMLRRFRVSVSDRYPVKLDKWKILGTFEARNSRDIQPFLVENPQIWARYVRVEILSHYGNEYYCPVSLLRVHGTRMLDSWKEADPADLEVEDDHAKATPEASGESTDIVDAPVEEAEVVAPIQPENQTISLEQSDWVPYWEKSYFRHHYPFNPTCAATDARYYTLNPSDDNYERNTSAAVGSTKRVASHNSSTSFSGAISTGTAGRAAARTADSASSGGSEEASMSTAVANATGYTSTVTAPSESRSGSATPATTTPTTIVPPAAGKSGSAQSVSKGRTVAPTSMRPPSSRSTGSKAQQQPSGSPTTPRNKTTTASSSASPAPTVQDSFFKALTKRLQTLESNTTLSLQYIESQSKFLQEALARLEKRQVAKVDLFLDTLNKTVLGELREVRTQYDQVWQSTVIALETQREQSEREIVALSARLGVLADEVVFQKRMAILQSVLLLGCLFVAIFSRGAAGIESYYPSQFLGTAGADGADMDTGGGGNGSRRRGLSYYTRLASPIFPTTPRARQQQHHSHSHHHHAAGAGAAKDAHAHAHLMAVIETASPPTTNGTPPSVGRGDAAGARDLDGSPPTEPYYPDHLHHHHHTHHHQAHPRAEDTTPNQTPHSTASAPASTYPSHLRRHGSCPSPDRTAAAAAAAAAATASKLDASIDFAFRPATPSSTPSLPDAAYDSEPATPTTRRNRGLRPPAAADSGGPTPAIATANTITTTATTINAVSDEDGRGVAEGGNPSTYAEAMARRSERQLTPSEDDDIEYAPSLTSRSTSVHATRKPLPALPEDPD